MSLHFTGVYKSQEARLMLRIYLIKVPAHASVKKMKEENWAMDGFVSIVISTSAADFNDKFIACSGNESFLNLANYEYIHIHVY